MKKKIKTKNLVYKLVIGTILALYAISILFALYWCIVTAFKAETDFGEPNNNVLSIPAKVEFSNVSALFEYFKVSTKYGKVGLFEILFNTLVYTLGGAVIATFVPCIVAYVTSRFRYKLSGVIYTTVIVTMALPIVGSMPASIAVMQFLHLYDNLFGALVQKAHFLSMYYLIFHATFSSISKEFVEAAYLDGASEVKIFFQIILPLVKTTFLTIVLIYFIDLWNDYQAPLIYLPNHPTLSTAVHLITMPGAESKMASTTMRMMACILMVLPTTTLFLIFKKKMMGNLSMGGVKG